MMLGNLCTHHTAATTPQLCTRGFGPFLVHRHAIMPTDSFTCVFPPDVSPSHSLASSMNALHNRFPLLHDHFPRPLTGLSMRWTCPLSSGRRLASQSSHATAMQAQVGCTIRWLTTQAQCHGQIGCDDVCNMYLGWYAGAWRVAASSPQLLHKAHIGESHLTLRLLVAH